jgi:CheY-like chemotaxis protein
LAFRGKFENSARPSFSFSMRTLLIVDDQPSVVMALTYLFMSSDYAVLSAGSGAEALALVETNAFDAALIDLHMPGMDGITLCRALTERSESLGLKAPIWIMTAAYTADAAKRAAEAGARSMLKKPFDCAELLKQIDTCLAAKASAEVVPTVTPPPAVAGAIVQVAVVKSLG